MVILENHPKSGGRKRHFAVFQARNIMPEEDFAGAGPPLNPTD